MDIDWESSTIASKFDLGVQAAVAAGAATPADTAATAATIHVFLMGPVVGDRRSPGKRRRAI
jgi:hypothetical protein